MQIEEAKIFNFGKLQNVSFQFKEGINIIYGENEQGKTTLHAFLLGMLFGIEKGRGRSAKGDVYSRYEPWHSASFYSGALRFQVDRKLFYLERNFYSKDKSEYLRNEEDGEELNAAYGDLEMLLGGVGREVFENTYDVSQNGAVTGKAMAELLTTYLAEAESGGTGEVSVLSAKKRLTAAQRELSAELKQLRAERQRLFEQKEIELGIQKARTKELRQQLRVFEEEQKELYRKAALQKKTSLEKSHPKKRTDRRLRIGVSVGMAALVIIAGVGAFLKILPVAAAGLTGLLAAVVTGLFFRGEFYAKQEEMKNDFEEDTGNLELLNHAKEMLGQLQEHLQENENTVFNMEAEKEKLLSVPLEELELQEEIESLELAESVIEKIAEEYYMEVSDELNGEISRWVSLLTNGAYDSAGLDKDGKLWILTEGHKIQPEALSRGTLEQIYLALRLAAGTVMMQEEEMPIFLDEAFAMYDDVRLTQTLKALAATKKQILLFTCQKREAELLKEAKIPYHRINMNR